MSDARNPDDSVGGELPQRAHQYFRGDNQQRPLQENLRELPPAPPWRSFAEQSTDAPRGKGFHIDANKHPEIAEAVNAAILLRRPLLVTGDPGTGKSSLAHAIAYELDLGDILEWPITTRSTLQDGLYRYDAVARLQNSALLGKVKGIDLGIGQYIRLGPLGTALLGQKVDGVKLPRVLLIDEIDKSDIDLPNDLLHVFEEGRFEIEELSRLPEGKGFDEIPVHVHGSKNTYSIQRGEVPCEIFPIVLMTSNGAREFPPAFLRRCLQLDIPNPGKKELEEIVKSRLFDGKSFRKKREGQEPEDYKPVVDDIIREFLEQRDSIDEDQAKLATDQLLNAVYLTCQGVEVISIAELKSLVFKSLEPKD